MTTAQTGAPRPLIAGNWKMNGTARGAIAFAEEIAPKLKSETGLPEILVCPPVTLIATLGAILGLHEAAGLLTLGGQDCHTAEKGAHTGDISPGMVVEVGASYVILGHSERRTDHGETDALVRAKAEAAHRAGLIAVVCIGETLAEREAGQTLDVVTRQIDGSLPAGATAANVVVAYEPVWAIGSGRTPTVEQVAEVHAALRARLVEKLADGAGVRLLYGGSVKASNAAELMAIANVDGALVGGASLTVADFWPIIAAKKA